MPPLKIYLLLLLLFIAGCGGERTKNTNPPEGTNGGAGDSTTALREPQDTLSILANSYWERNQTDSAVFYFKQAVHHAQQQGTWKQWASSLNDLGILYDQQGVTDSALIYYKKALQAYTVQYDSLQIARVLVNIGIVLKNAGDYKTSMSYCVQAAAIFKSHMAAEELSDVYTVMGNILKALNDMDGALRYHNDALEIRIDIRDSIGIAGSYNNLGNTYRYKGDYTRALQNYAASLQVKREINAEQGIAITLDNIAETYSLADSTRLASQYFEQALVARHQLNDTDGIVTTTNRIAAFYFEQDMIQDALRSATQAEQLLSHRQNLRQSIDNAHTLSKISFKLGQYKKAADYAQRCIQLKDQLLNEKTIDAVTTLEKRYKIREKERELYAAQKENAQQRTFIQLQRWLLALSVLGIILLLSTVYLVWRLHRQSSMEKTKIEILMRELKHRVQNNLQMVLSMIQLQLRNATTESQSAALLAVKGRVQSVNAIHDLLDAQDTATEVQMKMLLEHMVQNMQQVFDTSIGKVLLSVHSEDINMESKTALRISLITNEWLTNLLKHGKLPAKDPKISLFFRRSPSGQCLEIIDNFHPWNVSLQGSTNGLGLQLISIFAKQIGANLQLCSDENGNTLYLQVNP